MSYRRIGDSVDGSPTMMQAGDELINRMFGPAGEAVAPNQPSKGFVGPTLTQVAIVGGAAILIAYMFFKKK